MSVQHKIKMCSECGCLNGHHPNCPDYDEADFPPEFDDMDAYREWCDMEQNEVQR